MSGCRRHLLCAPAPCVVNNAVLTAGGVKAPSIMSLPEVHTQGPHHFGCVLVTSSPPLPPCHAFASDLGRHPLPSLSAQCRVAHSDGHPAGTQTSPLDNRDNWRRQKTTTIRVVAGW